MICPEKMGIVVISYFVHSPTPLISNEENQINDTRKRQDPFPRSLVFRKLVVGARFLERI
jgi:hypothetical protein